MAAPMDFSMKLSKSERRERKKHLRSQHTLFRHENIRISNVPTEHLVVGNGGLGNDVAREELWKLFSQHGNILDILMQPRKPFSFVSYSRATEAQKAIDNLHGRKLSSPQELSNPDVVFYLSYVECVPGYEVPKTTLPPGLVLLKDFITEDDEQKLLACIDWENSSASNAEASAAASALKHRRVKHYGYEFIYGINNIDTTKPLSKGIPQECQPVLDDLKEQGYLTQYPDQLTVNQYQPGQGIPPHIDTHSACEDGLISLSLGSQVVMDFRHPDGRHIPVLLPPRSAAILTGESRYVWTHGITPRKSDIIPVTAAEPHQPSVDHPKQSAAEGNTHAKSASSDPQCDQTNDDNQPVGSLEDRNMDRSSNSTSTKDGVRLTMVKRGVRTSLTFRKSRSGPCQCKFAEQCDSQQKEKISKSTGNQSPPPEAMIPKTEEEAALLEQQHVHKVYENIADHFSDTRHKAWPKVAEFLSRQEEGAIIADIGCGNGKYLGVNSKTYSIGCDRSANLCQICHERGYPVFVADVLSVPLRDNSCNVAISIAVIHHLSIPARRSRAVQEMVRILRIGGQALISVWAFEQELEDKQSNYLSQSRVRRKQNTSSGATVVDEVGCSLESQDRCLESAASDEGTGGGGTTSAAVDVDVPTDVSPNSSGKLTVHVNRTNFEKQDLLVPWHKKNKENRPNPKRPNCECSVHTEDGAVTSKPSERESIHHRFYHVFQKGELEELVCSMPNTKVIDNYHDRGNWCIIFEKTET